MSASGDASEFLRGCMKAREVYDAAIKQALEKLAYLVIGEAKQHSPEATGNLMNSGTVGQVSFKGAAYSVELGFNTPYAAIVHETWKEGGEYSRNVNPDATDKYLERAMRKYEAKGAEFLAREIRATTEGAGTAAAPQHGGAQGAGTKTIRVREHTREDGTVVKAHDRIVQVRKA